MASIKVLLNKSRLKRDETFPVVFQVLCKKYKKLIYSDYSLKEENFDTNSKRTVTKRGRKSNHFVEIDQYISKTYFDLNNILIDLENHYGEVSAANIVDRFKLKKVCPSLLSYMESLYKELKMKGKNSTANGYKNTRNRVGKYIHFNEKFSLFDITPKWLNEFIAFLESDGLRSSTIQFYVSVLSTIYSQAVLNEIIFAPVVSPFSHIKIKLEKTAKRAVSSDVIAKIAKADLSQLSKLDLARDIFMVSFYARGMSFVDVILLKRSDIKNGYIVYKRSKTGQLFTVKIEPALMELINKYKSDSEYLFPIIMSTTKPIYDQYRNGLRRVNEKLKDLSSLLNLDTILTTYVARHSWATIAKESGIPIAVISEGLGHTSEKTTAIYLKEFDHSVIDNANAQICNLIMHSISPAT